MAVRASAPTLGHRVIVLESVMGVISAGRAPAPLAVSPPRRRDLLDDGPRGCQTKTEIFGNRLKKVGLPVGGWVDNRPLEKLVHSTYIGPEVIIMAATKQDRRLREERLGFRVDEPTKALIERAAQLERRKLTDFCMTALTEAARRTIAEHETIVLSDRDRAVFFDTLVNPPVPNERLQRALAEHQRRVVR